MRKHYCYLTEMDRLIIEKLYNRGKKASEIAFDLGVSQSTISRELRRGMYDHLDGDTWLYVRRYSAQIAQADADYKQTAKGAPLKLGNNYALATHIECEILSGKSPDIVIAELTSKGKRPFSTTTLYRYIDSGVFLNITNKNLMEKLSRKRKYKKVSKAKRPPAGKSIEKRPEYINNRSEFGHWEMDCIIGKSKGNRQALLTLTERTTSFEIVMRIRNKNSHSVVRALDKLQRQFDFATVFKSITVDNGSEFSDCEGMEHTKFGEHRTDLYYCHPYTSCERGQNERMNRMLRRFFPKYTSLYKVTQAQCTDAADWLNAYPRKSLNYEIPAALFTAALKNL